MQSQEKNTSMQIIGDLGISGTEADFYDSYEGLPPDYTLGHNMLAGAFAGIAVRLFAPDYESYMETDKCTRNIQ
jgi:hypothetical protein